MKELRAVIFLLFTIHLNGVSQIAPVKSPVIPIEESQMLSDLKKAKTEHELLNSSLKLGSYYLYKPGEEKSDLDNADHFLNQAMALSTKLKVDSLKNKARFVLAEVLFERGKYQQARSAYLKAIDSYIQSGQKEAAALAWISIGYRVKYSADTAAMAGLYSFNHALILYEQLHDREKEADIIKDIGDMYLTQGKLDLAENELQQALKLYKTIGYKNLHYTYDLLSGVNVMKGNFNKALFYSLEMIKSVQATGDTANALQLYIRMAGVYKALNQDEKSIYWYKRAVQNVAKKPNELYFANTYLFKLLIKAGKIKEVLVAIKKLTLKSPPVALEDKLYVAMLLGDCHSRLGNDKLAEKYYLQMVAIAREIQINPTDYTNLVVDNKIADFYLSRKKHVLARHYLIKILAAPPGIMFVDTIRNAYHKLFKCDSANGNYLAAIKSYQHYKFLTDSIFTISKAKQVTQLQLQYAKDQQVQRLVNKSKLQQIAIQHASTVQRFIIGSAGLLLLSLMLGYRRYRLKQFSNLLLQKQQKEINQINRSLQITITEKEILLIEKDWLLKEVHHRVKNNLHMIISLLESQSAYLENDALNAMESSLHRVFAMSLIHQKLYQSEEVKTVDMSIYFAEFVGYLRDSLDGGKYIHFSLDIEPILLGVSQAIPLALVLNEAVTNAIKYAFPDDRQAKIIIKMQRKDGDTELIITDNGIGMPIKEDNDADSLGLKLMKGLIKEIGGKILFENNKGTMITITFNVDLTLENYQS